MIYKFPKINSVIEQNDIQIKFDDKPVPKLIKYGFDHVSGKLDMMTLTSNEHYRAGIGFDLTRTDNESIKTKCEKTLKISNFNQTTAEFWELINVFRLITQNQTIVTSHPETVDNIVQSMKKTIGDANKITISKNANDASVILHKYSDVDLEENILVQLLMKDMSNFFDQQSKGSSLIIQIFDCRTMIMSEIIFYLCSLYDESFIYRPSITSDLSDSKYIVLSNLKNKTKIKIPKLSNDGYISNMLHHIEIDSISTTIQCLNSDMVSKKLHTFYSISKYLDSKVYEGATYQELIDKQNKNIDDWIKLYTDQKELKILSDKIIEKNSTKCNFDKQFNDIF